MAARATPIILPALQLKATDSNGVTPSGNSIFLPRLSISKPSWIVRTESNVRREKIKKPDPPCVICNGSGRVDCHHCCGRGRTNFVDLEMLPKGEWPKWCRTCGGSGLGYCSRCLGTGEYRYIMGFQFMKMENDESKDPKKYEDQTKQHPRNANPEI
ncbi:uncharacterized protein LOC101214526 [Cucumis sativus]|uniref:Uncharacterized protein n=1 Tax=Cucumis sativus TaxID=3659 RepID=A0A0A0KBQ1_CUCSA|nr:uncharacterized protein LOC101214526 [Cucumis sativus]KGN46279.1 hypothetical protein Csa_005700 [Cucumis sativus]